VGLQPLLTSTIANRLLGERVAARQWVGLILGLLGIYLVVQDKATTGGTTLLAWVAAIVALISITFGTIYQKRFGGGIDWRPGMLIQYAAPVAQGGVHLLRPSGPLTENMHIYATGYPSRDHAEAETGSLDSRPVSDNTRRL
jgi:drug/metabolite transporter (DMT)-like permease